MPPNLNGDLQTNKSDNLFLIFASEQMLDTSQNLWHEKHQSATWLLTCCCFFRSAETKEFESLSVPSR